MAFPSRLMWPLRALHWVLRVTKHLILFAVPVLLVTACTATSPWQDDNRVAQGRISVKRNQRLDYARFRWQWKGNESIVTLQGLLGQTLAKLTLQPGKARYQDANGQDRTVLDINAWLEAQLGWVIPMDRLAYWLQGRSAPEDAADVQDSQAERRILQSGWEIRASAWDRRVGGKRFPMRLQLKRADVDVSVFIFNWQP